MKNKISRRQELGRFAGCGDLRQLMEVRATGLSTEAIDLLVDIVIRYCESENRIRRRNKLK